LLSISLELLGNTKNITPILLILMLGFLMLFYYYKHAKRDNNPISSAKSFSGSHISGWDFRQSGNKVGNQLCSAFGSANDTDFLRPIGTNIGLDCSTNGSHGHVWKIFCHWDIR
jgi:hypothetical protein